MRNIIAVLLMGPMLTGCLISGDSSLFPDDEKSGDSQVGNSEPTISGQPPANILFGEEYDFEPFATDVDDDPLTFSVQNKPAWATFDASSGRLSGRPSLADIGTYSDIVISVSDGKSSASLPSYSVAVIQSADGSVTLSWVAPTSNTDGSALDDLAGYKIYYGKSSGNYDTEIRIDNESITTYVVDQLSPDTYYFSATALNNSGLESAFSGEAVRTVN